MSVELKEYTIDEIKERDGENGKPLWVIIKGKVYDMTNFAHPGGKDTLKDSHGEDREEEFFTIHSKGAIQKSKEFLIGKVKVDESKKNNDEERQVKKPASSNVGTIVVVIGLVLYIAVFKFNIFGLFNRKGSS